MLQDTKKTHTEVKQPQISIPRLADYMAASEQAKRTIAQSCKYRAIARVVQHDEAKAAISSHMLDGSKGAAGLKERAATIRNKLADDDFEADLNDHNADYIEQFCEVMAAMKLPAAQLLPVGRFSPLMLSGVKVTFVAQLLLRRTTKTNKVKSGALMLRYAKGKALPAKVADFQSSAIFGYMQTLEAAQMAEAERELCITLDAYTGTCHEAPGKAVYLFKEMKAACETLAERWPAIKPPKSAIL
jgi:hypothetical protein